MKLQIHMAKDRVKGCSTAVRPRGMAVIFQYIIQISTTADPWTTRARLQQRFKYASFGSHLPFYALQALIKLGWVRRQFFRVGGKSLAHYQVTRLGLDHAYFMHVKERLQDCILRWCTQNANNCTNITGDEVALASEYSNPSTRIFMGTWKNLMRLGYIVPTPGKGNRGYYTFNPNPAPVAPPANQSPVVNANAPNWSD